MAWPNCTLVLLPGLDGTGVMFKPFMQCFPSDAQVKIVSYPPDQVLDYDQLADLVRSQLPTTGKIVVLAESFSGPIAARLTSIGNLFGIVLCASFLQSPHPTLLRILRMFPLSLGFQIRIPQFLLRFACFGSECSDSTVELVHDALEQVQPHVLASRMRLLAGLDDLSKISRSNQKLCYLRASEDRLVPLRCATEIQQVNPSVQIYQVKGPHFLLQSSPEAAYTVVRDFCNRVCAAT